MKQVNWFGIEDLVVSNRENRKSKKLTKKLVGNWNDPYFQLWHTACDVSERMVCLPFGSYILHDTMVVKFKHDIPYPQLDYQHNQERLKWFTSVMFNFSTFAFHNKQLGWIKPSYKQECLLSELKPTMAKLYVNFSEYQAECIKIGDDYYSYDYFKALQNLGDYPVAIYSYDYVKQLRGLGKLIHSGYDGNMIVIDCAEYTMVLSPMVCRSGEPLNDFVPVIHLYNYDKPVDLPDELDIVQLKDFGSYKIFAVLNCGYDELKQFIENEYYVNKRINGYVEKYFTSNYDNIVNILRGKNETN